MLVNRGSQNTVVRITGPPPRKHTYFKETHFVVRALAGSASGRVSNIWTSGARQSKGNTVTSRARTSQEVILQNASALMEAIDWVNPPPSNGYHKRCRFMKGVVNLYGGTTTRSRGD